MLVLSRREGESIVIRTPEGRKIKITVVSRRNRGSLRIGVDADRSVKIDREEIDRIYHPTEAA